MLSPSAFLDFLADILRLPAESIAMAHMYLNKYKRFQDSPNGTQLIDDYTLSLACLSLSSKATENPRRMREILLPAHHLLHKDHSQASGTAKCLTVPSAKYDRIRDTVVQVELVLLRVLGFELRLPLPLDYLPRYLHRALEDIEQAAADYDDWNAEEQAEYGVVSHLMNTLTGKAATIKAVEACKSYHMANLFPPRTIALAVLYVVMRSRGLLEQVDRAPWTRHMSGHKVDIEDFEEAVEYLRKHVPS